MNPVQAEQEVETPKPAEELVGDVPVERHKPSKKVAASDVDARAIESAEEHSPPGVSTVQRPIPSAVTNEQVQAAVFDRAADRILFAKAVSDIGSHDTAVRMDAVRTMAGIRHELSVKALHAQVASDMSVHVRQECIKALTALEMKEGLFALEQALADRTGSVRLTAVWGMYRLGGAASAPALLRMLSDNSEGVRQRAVTCIGWLGREELSGQLAPLLNDSRASVRRAASEAMGLLGNRRVVLSLIEHLRDPDEAVRKSILGAIEKITGEKIGEVFPQDEADMDLLMARWHQRWREELSP
jgi:HEAT repeat protein